jgi:hypothetical protein
MKYIHICCNGYPECKQHTCKHLLNSQHPTKPSLIPCTKYQNCNHHPRCKVRCTLQLEDKE